MHLIEIHDHPHFPAFLRDLVTDGLQAMWDYGNFYKPIAATLRRSLALCATSEVLDLCSGGGGPWLRLAGEVEAGDGHALHICLTDKFPNLEAFERARAATGSRIDFCAQPVDATNVPAGLRGFRTIFSSFHHFRPEEARQLLRNAVESGEGIGVFEAAKRSPKTFLLIFWVPVMALGVTPLIRPFRWSRLLWTYLLPVVPFVLWFDGIVSCLRTYSQQELRELVEKIPASSWEIGESNAGLLPVTYLIGYPERTASPS
ncbi:MAG TPA: class I SAM-dependent methyltransferase [Acidisarcina sp.]